MHVGPTGSRDENNQGDEDSDGDADEDENPRIISAAGQSISEFVVVFVAIVVITTKKHG